MDSAGSVTLADGAISTGTGAVSVTAGTTIDESINGTAVNITGGALTLSAGGAIGDNVDTTDAMLDIQVGSLTATTSGAGEIYIREADGLTLTNVDANDGAIYVASTTGDITVNTVTDTAGSYSVTLNAVAGSILDDASDVTDIDSPTISLTRMRMFRRRLNRL